MNFEETINQFQIQILNESCVYICKMVIHDYELINLYKFNELAAGIVDLGIKIISCINDKFQYELKVKHIYLGLRNTKVFRLKSIKA